MKTRVLPVQIDCANVRRLLWPLGLAMILIMATSSWATSCASSITLTAADPYLCRMSPGSDGSGLTVSIKNLSFTSQAQGIVLIYDNASHTVLSDVVAFYNVNGVATAEFLSVSQGSLSVPQNLPILGQFTEGQENLNLSVALSNGQFLHAAICSGLTDTGCKGSPDALKLSVSGSSSSVPEPSTFLLLGTGLLPGLKRLFNRKQLRHT